MSSRCLYCHSIVTPDEDHCYLCGASMPKLARAIAKPHSTGWANVVFLGSLAFTAYGFFGSHLFSLPMTVAISSSLLLLRIAAEWFSNKPSN